MTEIQNILPADAKYWVCQDRGGSSFKSVVSVMDKTVNPEMETKGKILSGVNRVLPLAVWPGVPERHYNLCQIMDHLKLHIISNITIVMYLCLLNAILSISSRGDKYACSFCSGPCTLKSDPLRTFGHLNEKYNQYQATGAKPKKMKEFSNVIQPCLTVADPEKLVMNEHPLPELHLLMGVVNHLIELFINVDPQIVNLLKNHNNYHHGYQGGGLDGNNSFK